ncbi:MAG: hypothetical protein KGN02_11450 [bacterium]|nr:hypothetical protein [bacterium]
MPKRILSLAFIAASACALAACNSGANINNIYGTPAPTVGATATPNPAITAAPVSVTVAGSPLPNQPVTLSTDNNGTAGTTLATQNTDATGKTTFNPITGGGFYCFTTVYAPPAPALPITKYYCGDQWQSGILFAF